MSVVNSHTEAVEPNLIDYDALLSTFSWNEAYKDFDGLPNGGGLNIAHEAIDRHAAGLLKDHVAIRWIRKDRAAKDFTYHDLYELSNRFANVISRLGVGKGDTVFTLTGRIPELYVTAFGTLKRTAIFCPLFSVFGPQPIYERLSRGEAKILVTTLDLFTKKIKPVIERLPALQYVLITDTESHADKKVLSLPLLMAKESSTFTIPPTQK
ncbi:MAG: AMP-binding protein, partial [Cyclobacteriaceae bacterium]|nr:AMP-binding protein [Cyclobacteriaceae bacterium]